MYLISCFQQMDVLSVHIEYNCESASNIAKELRRLQVQQTLHTVSSHFIFL